MMIFFFAVHQKLSIELTFSISKPCMSGSIYLILPSLSFLAEMTFPPSKVTNPEKKGKKKNKQERKTNKQERKKKHAVHRLELV